MVATWESAIISLNMSSFIISNLGRLGTILKLKSRSIIINRETLAWVLVDQWSEVLMGYWLRAFRKANWSIMDLEWLPIGVSNLIWVLMDHMPLLRKAEQLKLQVWPLLLKLEMKFNTQDWATHIETWVVVPKAQRMPIIIMELMQLTWVQSIF